MSEMYEVEQYESREAWLARRHLGIGASDVTTILGINRWRSAYSLWAEKTEPLMPEPKDDWLSRAERREPWIVQEFSLASGIPAEHLPKNQTFINRRWSQLISASVDALAEKVRPLECKTAQFGQAGVWRHKVPLAYLVQVNMQLAVMEQDYGFIAVEIDGITDFRWHRVNRNERIITAAKKRCDEFWEKYVAARVAPPLDYSEATRKVLARVEPDPDRSVVDLPYESSEWVDELEQLNKEIEAKQQQADLIGNRIRASIGRASYGRLCDGSGWSFKANGKGTRTLRRVKKIGDPNEQ